MNFKDKSPSFDLLENYKPLVLNFWACPCRPQTTCCRSRGCEAGAGCQPHGEGPGEEHGQDDGQS